MNWFEKALQQVMRIYPGTSLTADSTEAEMTDFLEAQKPLTEALENSDVLTQMQTDISDLQSADKVDLTNYVTQEVFDNKVAENAKLSAENLKLIKANKAAFAKGINEVKSASSADQSDSSEEAPIIDADENEDNKDQGKWDMADLESGDIVPGLGLFK